MAEIVLAFMLVAAVLYAVLGGADFGAAVVEMFVPREDRERIDVALSPVWEANHVWLVLIAVLSFVAFPPVFAAVTTYLHIPLLLVLLGIVARGTAFTFRHYDPDPSALRHYYTWAFRAGSMLAPLCLGIAVAATGTGQLETDPRAGFYAVFVEPWTSPSCLLAGVFVCALFTFEGAALLSAEVARAGRPLPYDRIARRAHLAAIVSGGLVLAAAYVERLPWVEQLLHSPLGLACLAFATALVPVVALSFAHGRPWLLRIATGAQVASILAGFFIAQFPVIVRLRGGDITYESALAPPAVLRQLVIALLVGFALIVPGMIALLRVYKIDPKGAGR